MRANAHIGIDQFDHQIMRITRMIADLAGDERVGRAAISEVLAYRVMPLLA